MERRIVEAEADAPKPVVREQSVGLKVVGQDRAEDESSGCPGHAPHTQWTVREAGKRSRWRMRSDRITVHEETV